VIIYGPASQDSTRTTCGGSSLTTVQVAGIWLDAVKHEVVWANRADRSPQAWRRPVSVERSAEHRPPTVSSDDGNGCVGRSRRSSAHGKSRTGTCQMVL